MTLSHTRRTVLTWGILLAVLVAMMVVLPQPAFASHCTSEASTPYKSGSNIYGFGKTTCTGSSGGVLHETKIKRWNGVFWSTRGSVQDSAAPLQATANDYCSTTASNQWRTDADSDHSGADLSPAGLSWNCYG